MPARIALSSQRCHFVKCCISRAPVVLKEPCQPLCQIRSPKTLLSVWLWNRH
ncbi:hypothetical protein [Atribacter laminatus]|uniref:hypothetical protein n=1 Tax=Atribacter laminatus TaxID=2847778 RepID=UPI001C401AB4|nr:hypothetical protein [Atribacter laminatus]